MKGRITKTGYRRNSPDVGNDFNIIPSNRISMKGVDFPVLGIDNLGNTQLMHPGGEYEYQGDYVTELPMYGSGGLTQWFAEEWVDIKTGKKCGRSGKDKKGRPYPACRPSKRVNSTTPKTKGEMSAAEKAKFKRKKKSGKRIDYNHKRELGGALDMYQTKGETPLTRDEIFNIPRTVRYEDSNMVLQDKPIWDGFLDEVTITPTTASEIAWQENRANQATGGLDPIYPVFELLSMGTGTAYRTGAGALARNTGKKQVMKLADHIIPGYQKGAKAYAKSMKVPSGANMNIADDVWSSGTLYGKGTSFQKQEALDRIANFQKDLSPVPFTHVHGTGANALEGIFKNKGLRPSSELQKSGDLVTGEILIKQSVAPELFKSGQSAVSAASIANPRAAAQYALDYGKGAGNYPVVFGINPRVGAQSRMSIPFNSSVQGETLFRNGVGFDEISNIFVPDAQRAAFMQKYGNQLGNIKLGSFDDYVNQAQALSGRAKITSAKNYLYQKGGSLPSYQTSGEVPNKILNWQDNAEWFNNRAVFNDNAEYNDLIKKLTLAGTHGFNPATGTLHKLDTPVTVDPDIAYNVNKGTVENKRKNSNLELTQSKDVVPVQISNEDWWNPNFNFKTPGGTANARNFAGQTVYMSPQEAEAYNREMVRGNMEKVHNDSYLWRAPGLAYTSIFTPNALIPESAVYTGDNLYKGNYGAAALSALGVIPAGRAYTGDIVAGVKNVGNRVVDAATLPKLKRNYTNINTSVEAALNERALINEKYGRLTNSYIKKANNRYTDYENFRSRSLNTSQIYNDYLERRIPLLTNFPTRDAWIHSGDVWAKRLQQESFLRNTARDFEIDPLVKGFKPKSSNSPLFKDLNLNSDIQDLSTGRIQNFRIIPPQVGGTGFKLQNNRVVSNLYPAQSNLVIPQEARSIVSNNISLLENNIPGFKVMGSSRGFADAGLPAFPKDYDGIMTQNAYNKYVKNQYPVLDQSGVAKNHSVTFNKNTKPLDIDFNIVEQGSDGKAQGRLAEQLYRKLDPDNYFKQSEAVISGNQSSINIPFTPEELIAKTDFTKQSIADAFEISSRKPKHINRPDLYLSYGDGNKVLESQKAYAQSLIGSRAYLPPQYPASEFADVARNKALLQDMKFAGDIESAAADPARMQAVLNDFYFSNTTLSRGIDDYNLDGATPRTGFTEWNPEAGGGSHSGAGLNNTLLGDTGYGNLYSHKQFKLNLNSSDPSSLVKDVNRLNFEQNLSPSELEAASKVLMKYNLPSYDIQTKADFLKRITPAGPEGLLEYNKITGAKYIPGNEFSESMYIGTANVFNPAEDLISMGYKNPILSGSIPTGKSWMVRQRNNLTNLDYPHVETMLGLNADEYSLLYNRMNTPNAEGIEKAIKRAKNQPGEYTDAMIQSWERKGELPYQQRINYNIELNDVSKRISDLQDASQKYYYRINDAERLQPTLIGFPMGLGVGVGFYNLAHNDARQARIEENRRNVIMEDEKAIQQALDLGVPDEYLKKAFPPATYEVYKEREDFINRYEGLVPLELNGRVFMVPPQYKKEYQGGGEKSTREKSNEKYGTSDAFTQYVSNPTRIRVVEEAERLDDTPRSTTGLRDDLTANYINQTIYGNPTTTPLKLAALQETKDWTFENIRPVQYPSIFNYIVSAGNAVAGKLGITEGNAPPARDSEGDLMIDEEMYAKVMGVPHKSKYISESKYKPSKAKDSDAKYYTINWDKMIDKDKLIDYAIENKLMKGDKMVVNSLAPFLKPGYMPEEEFKNIDPLQNFTIGIGEDDKGRYLSVYDKYDFNKTFNTVTSPFEIYDRFYLYEQGGESIPVYNTYKTKNRAWLAARKNLGAGRTFMYGGKVYSTSTPKGL